MEEMHWEVCLPTENQRHLTEDESLLENRHGYKEYPALRPQVAQRFPRHDACSMPQQRQDRMDHSQHTECCQGCVLCLQVSGKHIRKAFYLETCNFTHLVWKSAMRDLTCMNSDLLLQSIELLKILLLHSNKKTASLISLFTQDSSKQHFRQYLKINCAGRTLKKRFNFNGLELKKKL